MSKQGLEQPAGSREEAGLLSLRGHGGAHTSPLSFVFVSLLKGPRKPTCVTVREQGHHENSIYVWAQGTGLVPTSRLKKRRVE